MEFDANVDPAFARVAATLCRPCICNMVLSSATWQSSAANATTASPKKMALMMAIWKYT